MTAPGAGSGPAAATERAIHQQLLRFLGVGSVGFGIDVSVMTLLVYVVGLRDSEAALIGARLVAWAAAIVSAFFLNARFTFGASIRHARFGPYLVIQAIGAGINLGTYSLLILSGWLGEWPLTALAIGAGCATISNFLLVRRFVYRFHPALDDPDT